MSLDKNLFTLTVTPSPDDPRVVDLVDPSGIVHYRKQRIAGPVYKIEVYDPMAESLLITATAPSATSKVKVLELCNPTTVVEMKYAGTLSFRWAFKWEEHEFEWKREECYMIRKPDPPVLVAVTKEPPGRIKTSSVQILDYNLNRFDIEDRKGLEIVILTALLTFQDSSDSIHSSLDGSTTPTATGLKSGITQRVSSNATPPPPPPKPDPKTGVDRIAELQAIRGEINEVTVEDEGSIDAYADYCWNLLQDEAMLFISVRSSEAEYVPKVLQVVHETKRLRHKAGLSDDDELHQYVVHDATPNKGPRRINLDDKAKDKYAPPESITIHLSKIPMPELQPKAISPEATVKESKSEEKARKKEEKAKKKYESKAPSPPRANRLKRNNSSGSSPTPGHLHVHSNQTHPYQPSPSPSQLNNPSIYVAPPPKHNTARPPKLGALNTSVPNPTLPPRPNSFHGGAGLQPTPSPPPGSSANTTANSAQKVVAGIFDKLSIRLR